jgi:hypothetical protein
MLRLACDTAAMDDLIERLRAATDAIGALRARVEAGEPWPLSAAYGAEPESSWGPKELLAHVDEMIPYWLGQIDRIVAAGTSDAVRFGRVATDVNRIERIGRDRSLPAGQLFERLDDAARSAAVRFRDLPPGAVEARGLHSRLGEMSVEGIFEHFVVDHVEEHARQLDEILERADRGEANEPGPATA